MHFFLSIPLQNVLRPDKRQFLHIPCRGCSQIAQSNGAVNLYPKHQNRIKTPGLVYLFSRSEADSRNVQGVLKSTERKEANSIKILTRTEMAISKMFISFGVFISNFVTTWSDQILKEEWRNWLHFRYRRLPIEGLKHGRATQFSKTKNAPDFPFAPIARRHMNVAVGTLLRDLSFLPGFPPTQRMTWFSPVYKAKALIICLI